MAFLEIVVSLGLGTIFGSASQRVIDHFLTKSADKEKELRALKQKAYAKTHSSLSRIVIKSGPHVLHAAFNMENTPFNDFMNEVSKNISEALLYSNAEVHTVLKEFMSLLEVFRFKMVAAYAANTVDKSMLKESIDTAQKIGGLEIKMLEAMRKDLGVV
jgi:hypothetical protein